MNGSIIFSVIAAVISVGGILIAIGVYKSKIARNDEINQAQAEQIEKCATKIELSTVKNRGDEQLAAAIKRSDEMLDMMRRRVEEDKKNNDGKYHELYGILNKHGERISVLETSQVSISTTLGEIKSALNSGFKEVREELKELGKHR